MTEIANTHPTEPKRYIRWLAKRLKEQAKEPIRQIHLIVETCGVDFAQRYYEQTLAVEANGGLLIPDGSRRRTIGGVFFYLVREALSPEQTIDVFGKPYQKGALKRKQEQQRALAWDRRFEVLEQIEQQGEVVEMRVTMIGYPRDIRHDGTTIITQMAYDANIDYLNIPSGVPRVEFAPMVCTVYIAEKQWSKVEKQLANGHMLRVMGLGSFDHETQTMALLATEIGTQAVKQSAGVGESEMGVAVKEKAAKPAKTKQAVKVKEAPAAPVEDAPALPDHLPPDAARKLQDLYAAAAKLRQKVEAMKVSGMQSSLKMTERLLRETEQQIQQLEREYQ